MCILIGASNAYLLTYFFLTGLGVERYEWRFQASQNHEAPGQGKTTWTPVNRDCAASYPGTKRFSGNPSLFAGIPMIFPVILGNQSKMELLYQEKEFVAGSMLGNEQLGNNSRETRGANLKITPLLVFFFCPSKYI